MPVLRSAKDKGLKLAVHIAEVPYRNEEIELLLSAQPDRLGHGTFIHCDVGGSPDIENRVSSSRIPIEVCLTSNVKGQTVANYENHHLAVWNRRGHPVVICTDDKGVFSTEGVFKLSRKHKYYYQIQGQMSILEVLYCNFVCWTPHSVHLGRIAYDVEFVNNMIPQLMCFFLGVILPEILCTVNEPSRSTETYCVCQSGKMIACDSTECEYVWFHYGCINLPSNFEPGDAEWPSTARTLYGTTVPNHNVIAY